MLIIPFNNSDVERSGTSDASVTDKNTILIANIIELSIFENIKSTIISEISCNFDDILKDRQMLYDDIFIRFCNVYNGLQ